MLKFYIFKNRLPDQFSSVSDNDANKDGLTKDEINFIQQQQKELLVEEKRNKFWYITFFIIFFLAFILLMLMFIVDKDDTPTKVLNIVVPVAFTTPTIVKK